MSSQISVPRYHRLRFYPNTWSTFDSIEQCQRPSFCIGCEYKHPFCTETGRVIDEAKSP